MADWDKRWMELCQLVSRWSKDQSTKVGAVIVNSRNRVVSLGYNGLPSGCNDDVEERQERPLKYKWFEHAERNAIYNAPSRLEGCTMYTSYFPCCPCARGIIQSGISVLVTRPPDFNHERHGKEFKVSHEMLKESEVEFRFYEE